MITDEPDGDQPRTIIPAGSFITPEVYDAIRRYRDEDDLEDREYFIRAGDWS